MPVDNTTLDTMGCNVSQISLIIYIIRLCLDLDNTTSGHTELRKFWDGLVDEDTPLAPLFAK